MKRKYIGKGTLEILENLYVELKYYILENEIEKDSVKFIEYGIEIEKQDNSRFESSQVLDITTSHTRIDFIVKSLMKNGVTPVHLSDVIEDML